MRERRERAIRRILRTRAVATQATLRTALKERGLRVDQSTLSRDLVQLGVRKVAGRYVLPAASAPDPAGFDYHAAVRAFFPCGPHMVVVRTEVGQAPPVALALDGKGEPAIAATLAGDDTIYVATRTRKSQAVVLRRLETWFGDKRER
jgi:transcriptional regulator of arginine metabolism